VVVVGRGPRRAGFHSRDRTRGTHRELGSASGAEDREPTAELEAFRARGPTHLRTGHTGLRIDQWQVSLPRCQPRLPPCNLCMTAPARRTHAEHPGPRLPSGAAAFDGRRRFLCPRWRTNTPEGSRVTSEPDDLLMVTYSGHDRTERPGVVSPSHDPNRLHVRTAIPWEGRLSTAVSTVVFRQTSPVISPTEIATGPPRDGSDEATSIRGSRDPGLWRAGLGLHRLAPPGNTGCRGTARRSR